MPYGVSTMMQKGFEMKKSKKMQINGPVRGGIVYAIILVIMLVSATAVPAATTFELLPDTVNFLYTIGDTAVDSQLVQINDLAGSDFFWEIRDSVSFLDIIPDSGTVTATNFVYDTLRLNMAAASALIAGSYVDSALYFDVTGIDSANLWVNLVVNTAPSISPAIGPQSVNEGDSLVLTVTATDPDGPQPILSISSLTPVPPSGNIPIIDSLTGAFLWIAGSQDSGSYTIVFTATDSAHPSVTVFESVTISVNQVPDWRPDPMTDIGNVLVCDTYVVTNFSIVNQSGNPQTLKSSGAITVSGSSFFRFVPSLASFNNVTVLNNDSIVFDSIVFIPIDLNPIASGDSIMMTLSYATNVVESFPIMRARGCAGVGSAPTNAGFGSINIGATGVGTIQFQNIGLCDLTITGISLPSSVFTVTNEPTYPFVLTTGNGFDFSVSFSPDILDSIGAVLTINHDGFVNSCPVGGSSVINLFGFGIDTNPPSIDSIIANATGDIVDIYVTDPGSGVDTLALQYRLGNTTNVLSPTTQPSFVGDKTHWQYTLDNTNVSVANLRTIGYEIDVTATDLAGLVSSSGFTAISGSYADSVHSITRNAWLGGNDSTWHLVSIPGNLTTASIQHIFQELSGLPSNNNVNTDSWRLVRINSWLSSSDNSTIVLTTQGGGAVVPGEGYWFRHFSLNFDGIELPAGQTYRTDELFRIDLTRGWNLIGNPFLFPVKIDTSSSIGTVSSFIAQNSQANPGETGWHRVLNPGTDVLMPWVGYAIMCESPTATIYLDPKSAVATAPPQDSWSAEISMISGGKKSGSVTIGLNVSASDGLDFHDCRPVTLLGNQSSVLIKSVNDGEFSQDIRSNGNLQEWELELKTVDGNRKTLSWKLDAMPSEEHILLLQDVVADQIIDMTTQSSYDIPSSQQLPENRFRVYLGRSEEVYVAVAEEQTTLPVRYKLYQNYPNPFNPTTSISFDLSHDGQVEIDVYNVLGERVRVLVSDYLVAGSHVVQWDGRSDRGLSVASGVYFAQMKAGNNRSTIKLSLIK